MLGTTEPDEKDCFGLVDVEDASASEFLLKKCTLDFTTSETVSYQKYSQHTRNMAAIPEIWSKYQNYGQNTRNMVNIPEIYSTYQKCG